jgi:RNA polymerase sigma-70 factor (ECF subfamily)
LEHFPFVWRNAQRLLGIDGVVDDVVQEVFIVALRRLPEFEGRSSVRTWLYSILRRVAANHRRTRRKPDHDVTGDIDVIAARESGPHMKAEKCEALKVLHEMLEKMDEDKREVFILAEIEGMSAPEIAEVTGTTLSTVRARRRDARAKFDLLAKSYRARLERQGRQ